MEEIFSGRSFLISDDEQKFSISLPFVEDDPQTFPRQAFDFLESFGFLSYTVPIRYGGTGIDNQPISSILKVLSNLGQADLSVGRIYEGHINALELIEEYGTEIQKRNYFAEASLGKIFGVWNTERLFEKVSLSRNGDIYSLDGAKSFCSGSLNITRPIITAHTPDGLQLIVLHLEDYQTLKADWSLWNPMGMKASVSSRIDFTGLNVRSNQFLGTVDNYYLEPSFSGGAVRFAAVQIGGAKAIYHCVIEHLLKRGRVGDTYQNMRIAKMGILIKNAELWLDGVDEVARKSSEEIVHYANMMRSSIMEICTKLMQLAEQSIGAQGFMKYHKFERIHRDMHTYLKQPDPDGALKRIGEYETKKFIVTRNGKNTSF